MIDRSNLADYADPILYDHEVAEVGPAGAFYLEMAKEVNGSVLELGCGTGRFTLHLAEAGVDITGLDIVPEMLARARQKAGALQVRWVDGDMRDFELDQEFDLIIAPGMPFEHLLTRPDQEAALSCVHRHLAAVGLFVLAIRFPKPNLMANSAGEQFWFSYETQEYGEVRVSGEDQYDSVRQIRTETAYRRWHNEAGEEVTIKAPLALRIIFPQEMDALLHYNRFSVLERYGDWERGPLTDESDTIIYLCRKLSE